MNEDKYIQGELFQDNNKTVQKKNTDGKKFLFSYSKMSLYNECPLKYKFKYVEKLPEKPKYFFAFGQAIHESLEYFHSYSPHPSKESLIEKFKLIWSEKDYIQKGYESIEKHEADFIKACDLLSKYQDKHGLETDTPFLLEYKTEVEVDGLNVIMVADRIEYLGDGLIKIIDYKTGKPAGRTPEQLYMYQKISELDNRLSEKVFTKTGEKVDHVKIDSLMYYYIEGLREKNYSRASEKEIEVFWEKALLTAENIRAEKFDPKPSERSCSFCDFKTYCPVYKEKSLPNSNDFISKEKNPKALAIDYARALIEKKEVEEKAKKIEDELVNMLDYGEFSFESEEISVNIKKETKYDVKERESLIRALKEKGIYERVLWPTKEKINELILSLPDEELKKELIKYLVKKDFIKGEARRKF